MEENALRLSWVVRRGKDLRKILSRKPAFDMKMYVPDGAVFVDEGDGKGEGTRLKLL